MPTISREKDALIVSENRHVFTATVTARYVRDDDAWDITVKNPFHKRSGAGQVLENANVLELEHEIMSLLDDELTIQAEAGIMMSNTGPIGVSSLEVLSIKS